MPEKARSVRFVSCSSKADAIEGTTVDSFTGVSQAHLLHQTLNLGEARGIRADIETERRITRRERKDASPPGLSLVVPRVVAARRAAKVLKVLKVARAQARVLPDL